MIFELKQKKNNIKIMDLKLKFELNKELDKEMSYIFLVLGSDMGGVDFSKGVTIQHPELKDVKNIPENDGKKIISKYFDEYYTEHKEELEKDLIEAQNNWSKVEGRFIEQINKIFKNPIVPEGEYIGYLSTINCNPRFLDNKTFQFFRNHRNGTNMVTAHEVLHFFFYDYAIKNHPEIFSELDTDKGIFWTLAEVFNDVVLVLSEFISVHGIKEKFPSYPAHVKYADDLGKLWKDNPDIDNWILEAYKYLNITKL